MSPVFRSAALVSMLAVLAAAAVIVDVRIIVGDVQHMKQTDALVVHTHEVLFGVERLLRDLVDTETGERGFVIMGDEQYLGPYLTGRDSAQRRLAQLGELTADNGSQQRHLGVIGPLVVEELALLERAVALRRGSGFDAARALVASGQSTRIMNELRDGAAQMAAEENVLLERRRREAAAAARRAIVSTLAGGVAAVLLIALLFEVARRRLRERAEAAVRAHAEMERFRITLRSVGDAVVVTDERGVITMLNAVAARLMRCGAGVVGQPLETVFRIVNEETRRPVESPVQKVLLSGQVAGLANHTVLLWPDGGEVPIDDSAAPITREDGSIMGVVLVFRDIRDRREAERAQQRTTDLLRQQDRRKDRFLATLSHELRNPLSPVRNALAVLQHGDASPEQRERALAVIERQVAHMARLVDDLLDVTRIAQGKVRLQKDLVDLAELVHRAIDDFQLVFARRQIALEVREGERPLWIEADAARLSQVTGNLLQNAAKFTDPGGRVTVTLASEDGHARVEVRDSGQGMDAATLSNLFQPFVQAEATIRRSASGLGLGLALSRSIVELHGGTVRASSPGPGKGAAFVVELPLVRNAAVAPVAWSPPRPQRPLHVLIIDDNQDAGETLRDLLELQHNEVLLARDAETGIVTALERRPDVVLCDIGLPGIDGYEAARRLRASGSTAVLVALTGHASSEDVQLARRAGFDHHLAKPVDLGTLMAVLASVPGGDEVLPRQRALGGRDQHP